MEEADIPQDPVSLMFVGGCNGIAAVSTATPTSENVILTSDKEDSGKMTDTDADDSNVHEITTNIYRFVSLTRYGSRRTSLTNEGA